MINVDVSEHGPFPGLLIVMNLSEENEGDLPLDYKNTITEQASAALAQGLHVLFLFDSDHLISQPPVFMGVIEDYLSLRLSKSVGSELDFALMPKDRAKELQTLALRSIENLKENNIQVKSKPVIAMGKCKINGTKVLMPPTHVNV